MEKVGFKKRFGALFRPSVKAPEVVDFPAMKILAFDGRGAPADPTYQQGIAAVFTLAYTIKFGRKKSGQEPDYSLGPLETSWYAAPGQMFAAAHPNKWRWTIMLWLPDFVSKKDVAIAREAAAKKHPELALDEVTVRTRPAHRAAQIMHLGPYSAEKATIERLHAFIAEKGMTIAGDHTEVYLSDPRRAAPAKLKTIIRYAVK